MGFAHPLFFLLLPPLAAIVIVAEARLDGNVKRRVARSAIRLAVLTLLVAALAFPQVDRRRPRPLRLVVAVDRSEAMSEEARSEAHAATRRAVDDALSRNAAITLLGFGERPAPPWTVTGAESGWPTGPQGPWPVPSPRRSASTPVPEPDPVQQSRPATGLGAARLAFHSEEGGGVLLLTTGHGPLDGLEETARRLRQDGLGLRALALPRATPTPTASPRVLALDVPDVVRGPFDLRARIEAPGDLVVILHVDGSEVDRRELPGGGARDVEFPGLTLTPGLHELGLVTGRRDDSAEDESRSALVRRLVQVETPPRIVCAVELFESSPTRRAIHSQGFLVSDVAPEEIPAALASTSPRPEILVLDAAAAARIPAAGQEALCEAVERGMGLFLEAGSSEDAWTRLAATPLARILPLRPVAPPPPPEPEPPRPQPREPTVEPPEPTPTPGLRAERRPEEALPISLMLVLDRSGSMKGPKLAMAIEAARRAAAALSAVDRVAVVTFAEESSLDVPPTPVGRLGNLGLRLAMLRADGNTDIYGGLVRAAGVLQREDAPIRHLILLTDGRQNEREALFGPLVRRMAREGITLTAVGLGPSHHEVLLKSMVQLAARGRYIPAESAAELPTILTRDTQQVAERRDREAEAILARIPDPERRPREEPPEVEPPPQPPSEPDPLPPDNASPEGEGEGVLPLHLLRPHEATKGVDESVLPSVGPPRRSVPVPVAALAIVRGETEPVLAVRRAGLGRVLVYALPPDARGQAGWLDLDRILVQGVRSVRAPKDVLEPRPSARILRGAVGERLRLDDDPDAPSRVLGATWAGGGREVDLGPLLPGREVPLPAAEVGSLAAVRLVQPDGKAIGPPLTYLVRGPHRERPRAGDRQALARALGEDVVAPEAPLLRAGTTPSAPLSLWPWFLCGALLLLPFDVALHRRAPESRT